MHQKSYCCNKNLAADIHNQRVSAGFYKFNDICIKNNCLHYKNYEEFFAVFKEFKNIFNSMHVTYMELPNFILHQNHTLLLKKILKISKLLMSDLELNENPAIGCIKGGEQSVP